ncbi:1-aminocyclopropane-1-carboxylate deaminase [Malaciobacter molluscorum LMG 25693]|uniref:1-aminocyclopropane-1-carboxylate deaminase n=1 Tax=Malaciobacter molluscorum LMG 25693 TaxID=870501 RepID=A0A2G1DK02_9BACT|nr:1-aminocyclopropane-1-carboxylate deaminase/D-cysteine desulfhydrase [Malaciobacter molluscorum]AXX91444.1 1-aminocyclopropane-1-carboxylate deaminase [Malaciobacter molluscorum LMG 25693]PHO18809.1 1-aminocyclopropane-1-carboxylate deaminase [Malaciobacter molluscorum LMG 25693]
MKFTNSPMQEVSLNNRKIFIKRDDLLDINFSGNKARKFYYFYKNDFKNVKKLISYGSAQANSLYSMSVLAKLRNWDLDFYVKHISSYLKENPQGNYKASLENAANIIEKDVEDLNDYISKNLLQKDVLYIQEGGRVFEASFGIKILAQEIKDWQIKNNINDMIVCLPSGTGTTALFLQKYLDCEVITCSCVGKDDYLKKQFFMLESDENNHPLILKSTKNYHFGKLYLEFYEMYKKLKKETKIEFDLLYDPLGFITLINSKYFESDKTIVYIHQGGLLGNQSMIERYERKINFKK